MTALFYYEYVSKLSEAEKLTIDIKVINNQLAVLAFIKKMSGKGKVIVVSTTLRLFLLVSTPEMPRVFIPASPIMRQSPEVVPSYTRLIIERQAKLIVQKNEKVLQSDQTYFDLPKNRTNSVDKIVQFRGGEMDPMTKTLLKLLLMMLATGGSHTTTKGFKPPVVINPVPRAQARITPKLQEPIQGNQLNGNNPGQGACKANLTPEQRRNLPSSGDVIIYEQKVILRHRQVRHKLKDHGYDFGIESTKNASGRFLTKKTPENIQTFKNEIKKVVLNGERTEGTYRKDKPGGYRAIHFYDPETKKYVLFKEDTQEFVSAWILEPEQRDDLVYNKNIGDF